MSNKKAKTIKYQPTMLQNTTIQEFAGIKKCKSLEDLRKELSKELIRQI